MYSSIFCTIIFKLPAPLIIIALWIISSQDTLPEMKGVFGFDKLQHFFAYAVLAAAAGLWFSRKSWLKRPLRNFLICAAVASVYGAIDEFHQYFVPGRVCDIWDWVANTLGGAAGAAAIIPAARFWEKRIQKKAAA